MLISYGVTPLGGVKMGWWGKQAIFELRKCVNISETVKLLLVTNRKVHMRFRLVPRSMTLDDLEL